MRSGSACRKSGRNSPSWMPSTANSSPTAPSENAAGYPSNRKTTSAANMMGAIFAIRNEAIEFPREREPRSAFFYRLDEVLDLGFQAMDLCCVWIRDQPAHHRDALDQLGDALNQQECEADHDQRFSGPLRQAAGVAGLFVDLKRADKERNAGDDHDDG